MEYLPLCDNEVKFVLSIQGAKQLLGFSPSADIVEVVRCKDCIHAQNMPLGLCYLHTEPYDNAKGYKGDAVCVEPDDYCSYGERREDNEG